MFLLHITRSVSQEQHYLRISFSNYRWMCAVNLKLLKSLQKHKKDSRESKDSFLLDLGTHGFHLFHGVLQIAIELVDWDLNVLPRNVFYHLRHA